MELFSRPVFSDGFLILEELARQLLYYYRLLIGYWILATAWMSIWAFFIASSSYICSMLRSQLLVTFALTLSLAARCQKNTPFTLADLNQAIETSAQYDSAKERTIALLRSDLLASNPGDLDQLFALGCRGRHRLFNESVFACHQAGFGHRVMGPNRCGDYDGVKAGAVEQMAEILVTLNFRI